MANALAYNGKLLVDQDGHVFKYGANTGSVNITTNGTHDVNGRLFAIVSVEGIITYVFNVTNGGTGAALSGANIQIKHNGSLIATITTNSSGIASYESKYCSIEYEVSYSTWDPVSGTINATEVGTESKNVQVFSLRDPEGMLGSVISWDDKDWLVCHTDIDNNLKYLIAKDIVSQTVFGSTNVYKNSTIATVASNYENELSLEARSMIAETTVNGVTAKVFVPAATQIGTNNIGPGSFGWFYITTNRRAQYLGTYNSYFTSSPDNTSQLYGVSGSGTVDSMYSPTSSNGFRPCIAVRCRKPILPQCNIGDEISWGDMVWLVCHYDHDYNRIYLIAKHIYSKTAFGSNKQYAGSTLASVAANFQANNMSAAMLEKCVDVTVNGVTAKVFVPSYEQMNGEFEWFNSDAHRATTSIRSGVNIATYWTSSPYSSGSYSRYINASGTISYQSLSQSLGFRPCVCVQL